jgi:hypothetical protein
MGELPDQSWQSGGLRRVVASRVESARLFGDEYLPTICTRLRAQMSGASDPWDDDLVGAAVALLRERLACWVPSHPTNRRFDDAVRELVEATLELFPATGKAKESAP